MKHRLIAACAAAALTYSLASIAAESGTKAPGRSRPRCQNKPAPSAAAATSGASVSSVCVIPATSTIGRVACTGSETIAPAATSTSSSPAAAHPLAINKHSNTNRSATIGKAPFRRGPNTGSDPSPTAPIRASTGWVHAARTIHVKIVMGAAIFSPSPLASGAPTRTR